VVETPAPAPSKAPPKTAEAPRPAAPKTPVAIDRPMTADEEQALYNACLVADGSKDVERVISAANEAVHRGTKKDWPYSYLVRGYTKLDQLDKALEYATRATTGWPDNPDFLRLRAETFAFRGEAQRALADFQRLHGNRAKELNAEVGELDKALKADPTDARARLLLGVYHYLRRHFDTASREFTQAIDQGQKRAIAWRAWAAAGMELKPEAIRDAKAYLAAYPSDFASDEIKALLKTLE
jgi:tetratricopeptide (TPR) repeat protein